MGNVLLDKIKGVVGEEYVKENEPMDKHCTFRCGGNAEIYVIPASIEELVQVINLCREEEYPYMVIGNGSNLLVRDEGYKGVIIEVNSRISKIDVIGEEIVVDAGAKLSAVAVTAMESDLAGFEFAHGIPGNIGGAVMMNAGAYGGEMKDVIQTVTVLDKEGNVRTLDVSELEMGYRTSIIAKEGMTVLQAKIKLMMGSMEEIGTNMQMFMQRRRAKQPLEYPSAGSTFKRPEGYFAGKLIEDAGLRGYRVGGAMVSEKHCGFVINYDNATASDVIQLMKEVQAKVKEKFGVELEPEVRII
jgi:UDP-N-acetylmuramate dehydrogenase